MRSWRPFGLARVGSVEPPKPPRWRPPSGTIVLFGDETNVRVATWDGVSGRWRVALQGSRHAQPVGV